MRKTVILLLFSLSLLTAQQTQFFRTYSMGLYDVGECVLPINDTNYVVAGSTTTGDANATDMLLFKTNSIGDVVWWKNIGGTGLQNAKGAVMAIDSTGYYLAGLNNTYGSTGYDVWLVRTDLNGDTLWTKSYGGSNWEVAHSINKFSDSTYIIAGETYSYGNGQRDVYLIHTNANGDTLWTKTYGGALDDIAKYVFVDKYDNILVIGNTESFGAGNFDVYVLYLNINGDTLWTKTIGTADDDFGYSADMYFDTASTAMSFVIGYTSYYAPDLAQNSYIIRIDTFAGNIISIHDQLESNPGILDHIKIRYEKPGICYYVTDIKDSYNSISIIFPNRTYYNLATGPYLTYASGGNESTFPNDIYKTFDKGFVITGYSENWGPGPTSCFLMKTDSMLIAPNEPVVSIETIEQNNISVFPNPVMGDYFYINAGSNIESIKIITITGKVIKTQTTNGQEKSITIEKPITSSGIYIIEVKTKNGIICKKIVF